MAKLAALNAWQVMLVVVALATVAGLAAWGLIWVVWTIRPLLTAAAALAVAAGVLYARRRHRLSEAWHDKEWIGS
jgi:hypothetical protein